MRYPRANNLSNARILRKAMTKEERHLWYDFLRYCTPRFRRQELIGPFIADYFCHKAKLVIELDGSQHMEPEAVAYDIDRTAYFTSLGITVVRFYNSDINSNFRGVCQRILEILESAAVNPSVAFGDSSPEGEP